jgi:hypothetical protein
MPNYTEGGKVKDEPSPSTFFTPVPYRDACGLDFIPTANYYRFQTP